MNTVTEADVQMALSVADGNIGAANVVGALLAIEQVETVRALHNAGIRGPAVWVAFKDIGEQDAGKLVEAARDMVALKQKLWDLGYAC